MNEDRTGDVEDADVPVGGLEPGDPGAKSTVRPGRLRRWEPCCEP